jgi:APA family basic amino acid/polyamine antiporter
MAWQILRRKSIPGILSETAQPGGVSLRRTLGTWDLISLGIGAIIGAGIFATIGTAAAGDATRMGAGPGVILSFVFTAVACAFSALSYAEFAALVPVSGSAYTYAYSTLGELVAWIIGWDLIIEYAVGNMAVAIAWAAYFHQLCAGLGWHIPAWLAVDFRSASQAADVISQATLAQAAGYVAAGPLGLPIPSAAALTLLEDATRALPLEAWLGHPVWLGIPVIFNFLAVAIVAALTWLLCIGIKESARANNVMVIIKLFILLFFIVVGVWYVRPGLWSPLLPNGLAGVWSGASAIFFAYIGFDAISTASEECVNPARDMPRGIIGSLVICTAIYVATAVVLTGLEPWQNLGVADPLAYVFVRLNMNWAAGIVSLGAVVAMTAVLLVFQLGQPRIFFAMSRDGLLPPYFARVHPRWRTPHVTTIWTGVVVAAVAAAANIQEIVDLANIGTLFAFLLVNAGIIVLRKTDPDRPRPFRTPWVPVIPLLGILTCVQLMIHLPAISWKRFGIWLLAGLVLYFCYGFGHSRLHRAAGSAPRE